MHRFFDRVAESYDQGFGFFAHFGRELARFAGVNHDSRRMLDMACGRGAVGTAAHSLSGGGGVVVGIDISVRMLEVMAAQPPTRVTPVFGDAARIPFRSGVFDAVLCGFALHIMPDADRALAEVHRVLRPGGVLAFSVPGPAEDAGRWNFFGRIGEAFAAHADPGLMFTAPPRPLDELVADAGFRDIRHGHAEIHLPLDSAEDFWAWHQSHGYRAIVDALPERLREEYRAEVFRQVRAMAGDGPVLLDRGATLTRASKQR